VITGKPFLRWVGGKSKVANAVIPHLPKAATLVEPFVGSGAIFMASSYKHYILADVNHDIITLYSRIKEHLNEFMCDSEKILSMFNDAKDKPAFYYEQRELFNAIYPSLHKSVLFYFLNKTGFNGVCRYNSKGGFNVPIGSIKKEVHIDKKRLSMFSEKLNACDVTLICSDFEDVMINNQNNAAIYCDPPYYPLSTTSNFTKYHTGDFLIDDQERLAKVSRNVSNSGTPVIVSNNDTAEYLYEKYGANIISIAESFRCVGGKNAVRKRTSEILGVF